jgi:hypothetical protein
MMATGRALPIEASARSVVASPSSPVLKVFCRHAATFLALFVMSSCGLMNRLSVTTVQCSEPGQPKARPQFSSARRMQPLG